jgi:hypothetical protein
MSKMSERDIDLSNEADYLLDTIYGLIHAGNAVAAHDHLITHKYGSEWQRLVFERAKTIAAMCGDDWD